MVGKRPRPSMRRTTSMTGITVNLDHTEAPPPLEPQNPIINDPELGGGLGTVGPPGGYDQRALVMVSPRYYSRGAAADHFHIQPAQFLRSCGLCHRRLAPGRDIYMYKGDTAFCSEECREQQMKNDERKNVGNNPENHHNHSEIFTAVAAANAEASANSETIAAA